jgi:hypothetical protein
MISPPSIGEVSVGTAGAAGGDVVGEGAALESEAVSAQAPSTAMRIGEAIDRGTATSYQIPPPDRPGGSARWIEARWIGAWGIG